MAEPEHRSQDATLVPQGGGASLSGPTTHEGPPAPERTPAKTAGPSFEPDPVRGAVLTPQGGGTPGRPRKLDLHLHELRLLAEIGKPLLLGHEALERWLAEGRVLLEELAGAIEEGGRDAARRELERLRELQGWLRETAAEVLRRARLIAAGHAPQDVAALVRDAAGAFHPACGELRIVLPPLEEHRKVPGQALGMVQAFHVALELLAHRLGGRGEIRIELEEGALLFLVRFQGVPAGEPLAEPPADLACRLRELVVGLHGGRIFPGSEGPAGASLVLGFPFERSVFVPHRSAAGL